VDNLGELARYAADRGVTVCIEPHVGGAIDVPERARWLVETVGQESCRIDFDISHFEVVGIPMEQTIPAVLPLSKSVEIKDQNFRYVDGGGPAPASWRVEGNGLGKAVAPNGRPVEFQFLLGGEGDFDLVKYLRLMDRHGWKGAVGFEASVQCQQRPNYDGMAVAANVYRWLADAWEQAGVSRA
jgi:sugar phosphate isomerase/epimerase